LRERQPQTDSYFGAGWLIIDAYAPSFTVSAAVVLVVLTWPVVAG
jgi:hypothetical protein